MEYSPENRISYLDKKVGWFIYPILGVSFIFFASGNDIKTLINLPSFKWDVAFSLFAVSLVGVYLGWLIRKFDHKKKFSWETSLKRRITLQFVFGIITPLICGIALEIVYLSWINIPFSKSSVLDLELPLSFIYLLLINLLYYVDYISQSGPEKVNLHIVEAHSTPKISITRGAKEILIPVEKIAFIRSANKIIWLYPFQELEFHLSGSLNEWGEKLPDYYFYRLNRQFIVHRDAIHSIEPTNTRRLKIHLKNFNEEIYVPKTRASEFRRWWKA